MSRYQLPRSKESLQYRRKPERKVKDSDHELHLEARCPNFSLYAMFLDLWQAACMYTN